MLEQQSNSSVVMSFGLFCPDLQSGKKLYCRFLAHEIYRVTPYNGITIHYGNSGFGIKKLFEEAGFKIIKSEDRPSCVQSSENLEKGIIGIKEI